MRFVREVHTLRSLDHPNIVRFVGAVWQPSLVLVLEWMAGGSVHQYLANLQARAAQPEEKASAAMHAADAGAGAAPARALTLNAAAVALDVAKVRHALGVPGLQPYVTEAATLCDGGCHPM